MKSKILFAGALSLVMVGLAYGAASKPKFIPWDYIGVWSAVDDLFARHDANGDGLISRNEANAFFEEMAAKAN